MSIQLFNRVVEVRIGIASQGVFTGFATLFKDRRISFSVERSNRRPPNTCSISIYNLDQTSRSVCETANFVQLFAGYGEVGSLIFQGDIARRGVTTERNGADLVTTIEGGDGELTYTESRFDRSYSPGTPNSLILTDILTQMGLGLAPGVALPPLTYGTGVTFYGWAADALEQICSDVGLSYSIQDGNVQILGEATTRADTAVLLSSATGLIGSPQQTDDGISVEALLNPSIIPGRVLLLQTPRISGFYKAGKTKHQGDNYNGPFSTSTECTRIDG